ncbi:RIP metalloprotease RseP [Paramaledivibacter caminithermalis]|uniref:Zinc metalloprotease n=1 Tax=Paramaledivibacter caminithermalis (strain DSM 15212 / CIP 107654 / DViRD3) TaxID=1121301 RepID=A0A1M6N609_PARC5|nr:RIP metalloprotease RseP [Paramaledivibacter caminithermalis]SHJ91036.1 regulator of sigma E protease [Paramaledivibacter caminithermalis DSM 15212]
MLTAISFVFVFGLLVFFHEFGHFALAKINNIKVHQFALGMGPKIISFKGKETEYSLRILPIGGYVKMEGEDEVSDDERSFSSKTPLQRISVLAAGPIMNIILAILLLTIIAFNFGNPVNIINETTKNSPAEKAGLKSGDEIIKINETHIDSWEDIVNTIGKSEDDILNIKVLRNGEVFSFDVVPEYDEETKRRLIGISPVMKKSLLKSVKTSAENVFLVIKQILGFLFNFIRGEGSAKDIVGPIGMVHYVGEAAKISIFSLLSLAAVISINLAILNILPFPALDGGRIIFAIIELIKGSPVDPEKEGFVHMIGFVILIALMIIVIYKDIVRFNLL